MKPRITLAATLAAFSLSAFASEPDIDTHRLQRECDAVGGVFKLTRHEAHRAEVTCDARDVHAHATVTTTQAGGVRVEGEVVGGKEDFSLSKLAQQVEGTCMRIKGTLTQDGGHQMQLRLSCLVEDGRLSVEAQHEGDRSSLSIAFVPSLQIHGEVKDHE